MRVHESQGLCLNDTSPDQRLTKANPGLVSFMSNYTKANILVLRMFIKDPIYTKISRDEAVSTLAFISTAGGLLGVCMGLSFVSIFEVIYRIFNFSFDSRVNRVTITGEAVH